MMYSFLKSDERGCRHKVMVEIQYNLIRSIMDHKKVIVDNILFRLRNFQKRHTVATVSRIVVLYSTVETKYRIGTNKVTNYQL